MAKGPYCRGCGEKVCTRGVYCKPFSELTEDEKYGMGPTAGYCDHCGHAYVACVCVTRHQGDPDGDKLRADRDHWRDHCMAVETLCDSVNIPPVDPRNGRYTETRVEELCARVDDAYRMGGRLKAVIERMRAELDKKQAHVSRYELERYVDDLAQIGTVLLGVKT